MITHAKFSDWLMVRNQGAVTSVNIINNDTPIGLRAHGHQGVNIFHGGFIICNNSGTVHQMSVSKYFRKKLK